MPFHQTAFARSIIHIIRRQGCKCRYECRYLGIRAQALDDGMQGDHALRHPFAGGVAIIATVDRVPLLKERL